MHPHPKYTSNTEDRFGSVAKLFHWTVAFGILLAPPLGIIAEHYPEDGASLDAKVFLFSLHKTVGIVIFLTATLRILWALGQPRPAPLHPERKAETFLAELIHYLLYGSMVIVPLSGWIHHAATSGFAPVFLPFGDDLFFVPKSAAVSEIASSIHWIATKILMASLVLHIVGALKHHVIDRDITLRRMWFGTATGGTSGTHQSYFAPFGAVAVWVVAIGIGVTVLPSDHSAEATSGSVQSAGGSWAVETGTLSIDVQQFGSVVSGDFAGWRSAIDFDSEATEGQVGNVQVDIDIATLTLGSVTEQALGAGYFEAEQFPNARFAADLFKTETGGYEATGTLIIREIEIPATLPFTLEMVDGVAHVSGQMQVDRRNFGIGLATTDDSQLGFSVAINVALTARAVQ